MLGKFLFSLAVPILAYLVVQGFRDRGVRRSTKQMATDSHGNYDLDGVSYDPYSHAVAVTGDARIRDPLAM
jgi:hypothetical protein